MGRRREPRINVQVPVRIFGTDSDGAVFSEKVNTLNISAHGTALIGIHANVSLDEIIGVTYGNTRTHFRVKWVGKPGTSSEGQMGLVNISPEKPLWDFPLPAAAADDYQVRFEDRRKHARYRCHNSVELHTADGASFWATIADLSVGGCYVEMAIPLPPGSRIKVGLWLGEIKCWADCEVAYSTPGYGIGVKFARISGADSERIRQFLSTLSPLAKKSRSG